jgi:CheY-like chemotaxis protein
VVREAVEICRDEIGAAGLNVDVELRAAEHLVEGDPARLQQIVWNLVKNAVKFTPKSGQIRVRSRNVDEPAGRRLVIEVSDTGVGIASEILPKIFHAFEQGDPSVTRQFGGLGLGLAVSRSLAEAHGGRLAGSSQGKNQGATFTLDLPITRTFLVDDTPRPEHGAVPAGAGLRLLLVEDNADTLRVMTRLLRRKGHRVTPADSVAAALEAEAAEGPFDLIVSDIGLPDGSGLDLMRQLGAGRVLPGIALSGFGMEEDLRKSEAAGFSAHLIKPVDFLTLDAAIRQAASMARARGEES